MNICRRWWPDSLLDDRLVLGAAGPENTNESLQINSFSLAVLGSKYALDVDCGIHGYSVLCTQYTY